MIVVGALVAVAILIFTIEGGDIGSSGGTSSSRWQWLW